MQFSIRSAVALAGLAVAAVLGLTVNPSQAVSQKPPAATVVSKQVAHSFPAQTSKPAPATAPIRISLDTAPISVIVQDGDTLSKISGKACSPNQWPNVWNANRSLVHNPNSLNVGWRLNLPGCGPVSIATMNAALAAIPAPPPPSPVPTPEPAVNTPVPAAQAPVSAVAPATVSISGYGGFQACVIARESGGNSQVMNASGHYGLYQFSASTWAAYGGNPASFGNASVAEQNQVFATAMASPGGAANWSPYDGC